MYLADLIRIKYCSAKKNQRGQKKTDGIESLLKHSYTPYPPCFIKASK